jgi:hypothetical protein
MLVCRVMRDHMTITPQSKLLDQGHSCAFCGEPILLCFREVLKMDIVCSYHRVPLLFRICNRPHANIKDAI